MKGAALGLDPGIIPARAGFTCMCIICHVPVWDHPRSRGVYLPSATTHPLFWGSSPLARGLPFLMANFLAPYGIIPARAGFTCRSRRVRVRRQDHPRSRGVYR